MNLIDALDKLQGCKVFISMEDFDKYIARDDGDGGAQVTHQELLFRWDPVTNLNALRTTGFLGTLQEKVANTQEPDLAKGVDVFRDSTVKPGTFRVHFDVDG